MNTPLTIPMSTQHRRKSPDSVWPLRRADGQTWAEAKQKGARNG